jgi:hypothetical protein
VVPDRPDKGAFFPGEVARMLGVAQIDNQRMRRIYDLVRYQRGFAPPRRGEWARFDYTDIACTIEVLRICDETGSLGSPGFRLALVHIRHACDELRAAGLVNPLLQAHIELQGKHAVATIGGTTFDVSSGQEMLAVAIRHGTDFLERLYDQASSADLLDRIEQEREQVRAQSTGLMDSRFDPAGPLHKRSKGIDPSTVRTPPRRTLKAKTGPD